MEIFTAYLRRIPLLFLLLLVVFPNNSFAAKDKAAESAAKDKTATSPLDAVLDSMDRAAANFRAIEADFVWDQYTRVADVTDTQTGKIYFRRAGSGTEMMADVSGPDPSDKKSLLYTDSKLQLYQPKANQVTIYNTSKNPEVESYLVLGFGGRGHDLLKAFDVSYLGSEKVLGIETEKINLVPKSEKVRHTFDRIILWIDPVRGISVQQQLFVPLSGDYRLAKYPNIRMLQKLSDSVFKLKTNGKTAFVTP